MFFFFFFQAEDGIRDLTVTGVQTCALPIWSNPRPPKRRRRRSPSRGGARPAARTWPRSRSLLQPYQVVERRVPVGDIRGPEPRQPFQREVLDGERRHYRAVLEIEPHRRRVGSILRH